MSLLRIVPFNVHEIRFNIEKVKRLCKSFDIIFLQKFMLLPADLPLLSHIHEDFQGFGISRMDCNNSLVLGRPVGGSGVLWRKALSPCLRPWVPDLSCESFGLIVNTDIGRILLTGSYFRPDYGSPDDLSAFEDGLESLSDAIMDSRVTHALCLGDFNADTRRPSRFTEALLEFASGLDLEMVDINRLTTDTFTFLSPAHNTVSWLDHALSSLVLSRCISRVSVLYDVSESDHMPLAVHLDGVKPLLDPHLPETVATVDYIHPRVNWGRATPEKLEVYQELTRALALQLLDSDLCQTRGCDSAVHHLDISNFATQISSGLLAAARSAVGVSGQASTRSSHCVPGWNFLVKEHHARARRSFRAWKQAGRPTTGNAREQMVTDRSVFKKELRKCKRRAATQKQRHMANLLQAGSTKAFWNQVRGLTPKPDRPLVIDGVSGEMNIAEHWRKSFGAIFDDGQSDQQHLSPQAPTSDEFVFTASACIKACSKLNSAATPGLDNVAVANYKRAAPEIFEAVAVLFNSILCHGFIPNELSDSKMIPIPKSQLKDLSCTSSYRGITITSTLSKIFEIVVANSLESVLNTSDLQFGFKRHHGTLDAVFALTETVDSYISSGSPLYACFLDLHKAFDSVDHAMLLDCLRERSLPPEIVHALGVWLKSQRACVQWGQSQSAWFNMGRGVRQGGCLSPILFTVFIDNMLRKIQSLRTGCGTGGCRINIIAYADDLVLLAPSLTGLQFLVTRCEFELSSLNLRINADKTVCMQFGLKLLGSPLRCLIATEEGPLSWATSVKYLGVVLTSEGVGASDVERGRRAFFATANYVIRRFRHHGLDTQRQVFPPLCLSLYGCEMWARISRRDLHILSTSVHGSAKRLLGQPPWVSTRLACLEMGMLPIPELLVTRRLMFLKKLMLIPNPIISSLIRGPRWAFSSFLGHSVRLCDSWGLRDLNFRAITSPDLAHHFSCEMMRSLEVRPPYQGLLDTL